MWLIAGRAWLSPECRRRNNVLVAQTSLGLSWAGQRGQDCWWWYLRVAPGSPHASLWAASAPVFNTVYRLHPSGQGQLSCPNPRKQIVFPFFWMFLFPKWPHPWELPVKKDRRNMGSKTGGVIASHRYPCSREGGEQPCGLEYSPYLEPDCLGSFVFLIFILLEYSWFIMCWFQVYSMVLPFYTHNIPVFIPF